MSNNIKVLIIGAGNMAKEYYRVLSALKYETIIIGRGEANATALEKEIGIKILRGGLRSNLEQIEEVPQFAVVAVNVNYLAEVTKELIEYGVRNILVEKPAGMNRYEIEEVVNLSKIKQAKIYVAYNRRFYASTDKALEIIKNDGGVTSFHFEFTEWGHEISKTTHSCEIKNNWFLANSSHVVDLAFYLGGYPQKMDTYIRGELEWHKNGCVYTGAGISEKGVLFSYHANWNAPGRWAVEILTKSHRLYFKPMETLQVQKIASIAINPVEIEDTLDIEFKPGLYRQVQSFLSSIDDGKKITIEEQLEHMKWYEQIEGIH